MMLSEKLSRIEKKRASSEPLPSGPAPYTSSSFFKVHSPKSKQNARSWSHHFSQSAICQSPAVLKAAAATAGPSGTITLGTGRPSAELFPWSSIAMRGIDVRSKKENQSVHMPCEMGESDYDLAIALNYGYAAGSPQLLRFITEHIEMIHDPPYEDWESCLTCGTTSAIDLCLQILCDPGDWVLVEEYTYSGTLDTIKAHGLSAYGVKMDEYGLCPDDLDKKLKSWDEGHCKKPRLLYMIPTGQNPTGATQSIGRRKAILGVANHHDLIIIEDDPYYFLQLEIDTTNFQVEEFPHFMLDRYISKLPTSYLSLDSSGCVIRLDSSSKILAPGLRCGWMTACGQIVEKFLARTELSNVSPSGPSQAMLYKLLDETWGHEGFFSWLTSLSVQYRQRRDILIQACERYMPTGVCTWKVPTEGMFLWVKNNTRKPVHRDHAEDLIMMQAKANGVLISKGSWFRAGCAPSPHVNFRLTFAAAPQDALDDAVRRLSDALHAAGRVCGEAKVSR